MLPFDAARALLAEAVAPLPIATVPLGEALGCRLAEAPVADCDLPPMDVSAMDGYAARATDLATHVPLHVAFVVPAGAAPPPLPRGACARIFTGAVMPEGADTVVEQERAEVVPDGRVLLAPLPPASNVRERGEVFAQGSAVGAPGELITPQRLAVLAAAGAARLQVYPRPRAALLLTGAELVGAEKRPAPGQIRNSNGPMLEGLCREAGLHVVRDEQVGDELQALQSCLRRAAEVADLIVTSGGVSVGDFDLLPRALAELGGETVLHKVAVQPGKPVLVGRLDRAWLVGLPGNPVSVFATWRVFARPLAEGLAGDGSAFTEAPLTATLAAAVRNRGDRLQLRPGLLSASAEGLSARVLPWKGSHDIAAAGPANCLVRLEVGADLEAGQPAACFPLPWRVTI